MPEFDPTKKHGVVHGVSTLFPNAKYSQDGYLFDSCHRCLTKPKIGIDGKIPPPPVKGGNEAKELSRLNKLLMAATEKLKKADAAHKINNTVGKRSALTKAKNGYEAAKKAVAEHKDGKASV